jgi:hypothetical protein
MRAYVVTDGEYSDYGIVGIYSTPEKAEEAKDQFCASNDVEEWEMDNIPSHPIGMSKWEVSLRKDGSVLDDEWAWKTPRRVSTEQDEEYVPRWTHRTSNFPVIKTEYVDFFVWAKDSRHALKVAHDRWAQLIATNEWTDDFNLWWERIRLDKKESK